MTDSPSNNDKKIQNILDTVNSVSNSPEEISAALDEAEKQDTNVRAYLANGFEDYTVRSIDMMNPRDVSGMREEMGDLSPEEVAAFGEGCLMTSKTVSFIFDVKGDTSDPVIKLYVEEAAKLTDAEYSQPVNHMKLFIAVLEKRTAARLAPPPVANPFRSSIPLKSIPDDSSDAVETARIAFDLVFDSTTDLLAVLQEAEQLPDTARRILADKLETFLTERMPADRLELMELQARIDDMIETRKTGMAYTIERMNGAIQGNVNLSALYAFVFQEKGDQASEAVKTYAAEAAKLSDAEYGLPENHMKVMTTTAERLLAPAPVKPAPSAPKPNPFRKNTPGT